MHKTAVFRKVFENYSIFFEINDIQWNPIEKIQNQWKAYPEMALNQLELIIKETILKYGLHRVAVSHHIGTVPPLEAGVLGEFSKFWKFWKNDALGFAPVYNIDFKSINILYENVNFSERVMQTSKECISWLCRNYGFIESKSSHLEKRNLRWRFIKLDS